MIHTVKCICILYFLNSAHNLTFLFSDLKNLASICKYPLHIAAREGNADRVVSLIRQGYSVNHSDPDLVKPLHEACFHGRFQCVNILLENGAEV